MSCAWPAANASSTAEGTKGGRPWLARNALICATTSASSAVSPLPAAIAAEPGAGVPVLATAQHNMTVTRTVRRRAPGDEQCRREVRTHLSLGSSLEVVHPPNRASDAA